MTVRASVEFKLHPAVFIFPYERQQACDTAGEARGCCPPVHNGGAPTAAGEAVNPAEVVDAAAAAREAGARKATAITTEGAPGCLRLLYGIGRSAMDGTNHGVSKAPKRPLSPRLLGSAYRSLPLTVLSTCHYPEIGIE